MLVYQFQESRYALDNLRRRRIKISQFDDLNDPFELLGVELTDPTHRSRFQNWRRTMAHRYGVLCFSRNSRNPVMWSHCADKHKGICVGYAVQDELLQEVTYTRARLKAELDSTVRRSQLDETFALKLLSTKFEHWCYEEELRIFTRLEQPDPVTKLYFRELDEQIQVRKIIAGPRCVVSKKTLQDAAAGIRAR